MFCFVLFRFVLRLSPLHFVLTCVASVTWEMITGVYSYKVVVVIASIFESRPTEQWIQSMAVKRWRKCIICNTNTCLSSLLPCYSCSIYLISSSLPQTLTWLVWRPRCGSSAGKLFQQRCEMFVFGRQHRSLWFNFVTEIFYWLYWIVVRNVFM